MPVPSPSFLILVCSVRGLAYYPVAPIHLMHWPTFLVYHLLSASSLAHLPAFRPAICASALFPSALLPLLLLL
ncbi:hypothetical protein KC333_g32 [Hortaea werneckii]|nr:hypothetical protein KC333_g32 [Hortaea werneckii]